MAGPSSPSSSRRVFVVGVGMTKFEKPGSREWDYPDMGRIAAERALADACVEFSAIQQVAVGYCFGDSTCGQRAVYQLGLRGVPVYNVNNNCATGSSALFLAKQLVQGGLADCALALGFEKMERGSLGAKYTDRTMPLDLHVEKMMGLREYTGEPLTPWMFASAAREYMAAHDVSASTLAKIAHKNHAHSVDNPYSQFRARYSLADIERSAVVAAPLTKLQCCPTSDGGAAAVVASEAFVRRHGLEGQAVEIVGMSMATDLPSTFENDSLVTAVGFDMTKCAATQAFTMASLTPAQVDVAEVHDCFSANELLTYDALGLCAPGKAGDFVERGQNTYGGSCVVNPSGGLISKGHPLGATGLAQCAEVCWQLRHEAAKRQVDAAQIGLSHNLGLGGAAVVTIYRRPLEWRALPMKRKVSGGNGFAAAESSKL